jgi:hypothetical protein
MIVCCIFIPLHNLSFVLMSVFILKFVKDSKIDRLSYSLTWLGPEPSR